ncbi:peritrophic matrix protein 1-C precursor [Aphelenchoides avenae]|nr:peritrophic matrix protein 1-C precursor [Aphelenchus avenae]
MNFTRTASHKQKCLERRAASELEQHKPSGQLRECRSQDDESYSERRLGTKNNPTVVSKRADNSPTVVPKSNKNSKDPKSSPMVVPKEARNSQTVVPDEAKNSPTLAPKNNRTVDPKEARNSPTVVPKNGKNSPTVVPNEAKNSPMVVPREAKNSPTIVPNGAKNVVPVGATNSPKVVPKAAKNTPTIVPDGAKSIPTVVPMGAKNSSVVSPDPAEPKGAENSTMVAADGAKNSPTLVPKEAKNSPTIVPDGAKSGSTFVPTGAENSTKVVPDAAKNSPTVFPDYVKNSMTAVPKPEPKVKPSVDRSRASEESLPPTPDETVRVYVASGEISFRLYASPMGERRERLYELLLDGKRTGLPVFLRQIVIFVDDPQEQHQLGKWLSKNECEVSGFEWIRAGKFGYYGGRGESDAYQNLIFYQLSEEVMRIHNRPELIKFPTGAMRVHIAAFYDPSNARESTIVSRMIKNPDDEDE